MICICLIREPGIPKPYRPRTSGKMAARGLISSISVGMENLVLSLASVFPRGSFIRWAKKYARCSSDRSNSPAPACKMRFQVGSQMYAQHILKAFDSLPGWKYCFGDRIFAG